MQHDQPIRNQNGLYAGVMIYIGEEEKQLTQVFGKEYKEYLANVHRLVPFKKP